MLKAASAPSANPNYPQVIDVDAEYLFDSDADICIDLFERVDSLNEPDLPKLTRFDRMIPFLIFGTLASGAVLALIGLGTVISWVF